MIRALGAAVIVLAGVAAAAPAQAATLEGAPGGAAARAAACVPSTCDIDSDGVADVVEEAICGSATCASGQEDLDGDGTRDADELAAQLPSDATDEDAAGDGSTWALELPGGMYLRPGSLALLIYGVGAVIAAIVVVITLRRQRAAEEQQ